jgi:hypothetical protein
MNVKKENFLATTKNNKTKEKELVHAMWYL